MFKSPHRTVRGARASATLISVLAGLVAFSAVLAAPVPAAAQTRPAVEFTAPAGSSPAAITSGPDGALWFTESQNGQIGRLSTTGGFTEYPVTGAPKSINGITAGPDGRLWFTTLAGGIGRMTSAGTVTGLWTVPSASPGLAAITGGPDGNLWVTENSAGKIAQVTPSGTVKEFPVAGAPRSITSGPDGNLWFTVDGRAIGRITPAGVATEFTITDWEFPTGITSGADGALWFSESPDPSVASAILGRITTAGAITHIAGGPATTYANAITAGPDGHLWLADGEASAAVLDYAPGSGSWVTTLLPTTGSAPSHIASGPDGNIWTTETARGRVARVAVTWPWSASYRPASPSAWIEGQTQTYNVTLTNTGSNVWPSAGSNPIRLGIHFEGGHAQMPWYSDQRFPIPADLPSGSSLTMAVTVTEPSGHSGPMVLEYQMLMSGQTFEYLDSSVNVTPTWSAAYDAPGTPATWSSAQTRSVAVTVSNNGVQAWPSAGSSRVDLGVHFAGGGGGHGHNTFFTDQHFLLPADLPAGKAVTLTVNITSPSNQSGPMVLEFQMVKESQFWFQTWKDVSVATGWSAAYAVAATPSNWVRAGAAHTYSVTLTNNGGVSWPATGTNPVQLGVHFASAPKQAPKSWYTDQRAGLAADLLPGHSVTLILTIRPPASHSGSMTLEYQMLQSGLRWFASVADVTVFAGPQFKGYDAVNGALTFAFDGKHVSGFSDPNNWWTCAYTASQSVDIEVPGDLAVDASGNFSAHVVTSSMTIDLSGTVSGSSAGGNISAQSNDGRGCSVQQPAPWSASGS